METANIMLEASLHVTLACGLLAAVALFLWLVRHRPRYPDEQLRLPLIGLAMAVDALCVFLWILGLRF